MNSSDDNIVVIQRGQQKGDPTTISINCLDQPGLAFDLARVLFEFGLNVVKGDLSKDGQWCLVIFWVTPKNQCFDSVKWATLKKYLVSTCPSTILWLLRPLACEIKPNRGVYILQTWSADRSGLLNGIAYILWDLEIVVQKLKASTTPDSRAVNFFYITDNREKLHEKQRQAFVCERVKDGLGDWSVHCKIILAGPEWGGFDCSTVSIPVPFIGGDYVGAENGHLKTLSEKAKNVTGSFPIASVVLDNSLSPAHSLLQISCKDRRGLLYDCTRTLRDFQMQVAFGRVETNSKGHGDIDLFVLESDGKKVVEPERQKLLCCRLEMEVVQPVKVLVRNRGPDTELLVASPIEPSGRGRPRVLYDTTLVIRKLDLGIFQVRVHFCL
ncbi:hypothetical protein GOP47_0029406 [Adiantum capillus-veneris]|nr:hypothetical protein GOP47_0029406 [Adiantum capillus-veneris]